MAKLKTFIILDRSGSMDGRWGETLGTLKAYFEKLEDRKTKVWLLAFDFEHIWALEGVPVEHIDLEDTFSSKGIAPRGSTALYDAVGEMKPIVDAKAKKLAQIVVVTDGMENVSRKVSLSAVKEIVAEWETKGYDLVFLGADFNNAAQSQTMGGAAGQTISYHTLTAFADMGSTLAAKAGDYQNTGVRRGFTDEEREKVGDQTA